MRASRLIAALSLGTLVLIGLPGCAAAAPIPLAGPTEAKPLGYLGFCRARADLCDAIPDQGRIVSGPSTEVLLAEVSAETNHSISYRADPAGTDQWNVGGGRGDCEDYALTKLARLVDLGYPRSALRLAVVRLPVGTAPNPLHVVLVAATTEGDLVLDSRTDAVKAWSATSYQWLLIEEPRDGRMAWTVVAR